MSLPRRRPGRAEVKGGDLDPGAGQLGSQLSRVRVAGMVMDRDDGGYAQPAGRDGRLGRREFGDLHGPEPEAADAEDRDIGTVNLAPSAQVRGQGGVAAAEDAAAAGRLVRRSLPRAARALHGLSETDQRRR